MQAAMKLNSLLASIGQHGLKLDKTGSCQMRCKNGLTCVIELMPDGENIFGYLPVSQLPRSEVARAALMQEALAINLQLQREDVLSLVYHAKIDNITLCSQLDLTDATPETFDYWLGNLIQSAERVRSLLIQAGLQASLARTREERRQALIARQEKKHARPVQTNTGQPTQPTPINNGNSLQEAIRSAQVLKL